MRRKLCLIPVAEIIFSSSLTTFTQETAKEKFTKDVRFVKNVIYFVLDIYQYKVAKKKY